MSREDPQLKLRLTEEMKAAITQAAQANGRSVNSEIVARLTDTLSLDEVSDFPGFSAADKVSMLHSQLENLRAALEEKQQQVGVLTEHVRNQREQNERLQERFTDYRRDAALELSQARSQTLPESLQKRIDRRARETGRTPQEEIVLALEAAFPPASETDEMIRILGELLGENPQAVETVAGDALRQYLDYLQEERAAGRGEGARARLQEVFEKTPDGRTVRRK